MGFQTYMPCDVLKPFVKLFAISESDQAESYCVLPDTGLVMGFQYSGRLSYVKDGVKIPLNPMGITGLRDSFRMFSNEKNTGTVLVIFSETGAAAFFQAPVHELFGESLSLDDLVLRSQMDVVSDELYEAKTEAERIKAVERFLVSRLKNVNDDLVNTAVSLIKQSGGMIRIAALCEKLYISQSQLEKRFRKTVGASPRKFASIVRFRNVLNAPAVNDLTALGLDAGYYDQAHFIKDFKAFTGQTPEQYFRKK